jgi:hypothetical protein
MSDYSSKQRTLRVNGEVLKGVGAGHVQFVDAPISACALLCLDLFETNNLNILWVAADVREMEKLHESVLALLGWKMWFCSSPWKRIRPCSANT